MDIYFPDGHPLMVGGKFNPSGDDCCCNGTCGILVNSSIPLAKEATNHWSYESVTSAVSKIEYDFYHHAPDWWDAVGTFGTSTPPVEVYSSGSIRLTDPVADDGGWYSFVYVRKSYAWEDDDWTLNTVEWAAAMAGNDIGDPYSIGVECRSVNLPSNLSTAMYKIHLGDGDLWQYDGLSDVAATDDCQPCVSTCTAVLNFSAVGVEYDGETVREWSGTLHKTGVAKWEIYTKSGDDGNFFGPSIVCTPNIDGIPAGQGWTPDRGHKWIVSCGYSGDFCNTVLVAQTGVENGCPVSGVFELTEDADSACDCPASVEVKPKSLEITITTA